MGSLGDVELGGDKVERGGGNLVMGMVGDGGGGWKVWGGRQVCGSGYSKSEWRDV